MAAPAWASRRSRTSGRCCDRDRRDAESVERRRQRVPAARARRARAGGRRPRAHGDVRALQPRRHAGRRARRAGGGRPRGGRPMHSAGRWPPALQAMFVGYALLGIAAALVYRGLPRALEAPAATRAGAAASRPDAPCYTLAALFSLDAFGGGFVVQSMLALWLYQRFDLSLGRRRARCSSATGVLSAFSYLVAVRIAAPHRTRQHDGVHAPAGQPVPGRDPVRARPRRTPSRCCSCAARCRRWTCRRAART